MSSDDKIIVYMGNMGYPVITRLGINQFWYKNWYTDSDFMLNFKQDLIFDYDNQIFSYVHNQPLKHDVQGYLPQLFLGVKNTISSPIPQAK